MVRTEDIGRGCGCNKSYRLVIDCKSFEGKRDLVVLEKTSLQIYKKKVKEVREDETHSLVLDRLMWAT